uniref:Uncharacterized protein n=1 Tax=Fagus sylvatica TaxID=28930 RepID=A0A2N9IY29_FAGSY
MAKNKGSVIIPEGQELWEWRGLSQVVDGLLEPNVTRNQANRTVGYGRPAEPILHHDQPESPLSVAQAHKMEPRWVWKPKPSLHKTRDLAETSGTTKPSTREDQESAVTTPKSHILTNPDGQRLRLSMELRSPMIDPDAQVDDISPQMLQWVGALVALVGGKEGGNGWGRTQGAIVSGPIGCGWADGATYPIG